MEEEGLGNAARFVLEEMDHLVGGFVIGFEPSGGGIEILPRRQAPAIQAEQGSAEGFAAGAEGGLDAPIPGCSA